MNLLKAIEKIRFNISEPDPDNSRFTDDQIKSVVNTAIKETARELKFPTRISETLSVKDQKEYDLPSGTIEVYDVSYDNKLIEPIEFREAQKFFLTPTKTGIPTYFYLRNDLILGLVPIPNESDKLIKIHNSYTPSDLISSTDLLPYNIPDYNELIILKATELLLIPDFIEKSVVWNNKYQQKIIDIRLDLRSREIPDYVNYICD